MMQGLKTPLRITNPELLKRESVEGPPSFRQIPKDTPPSFQTLGTDSRNQLHKAIFEGNTDLVRKLLVDSENAGIANAANKADGITPLMTALSIDDEQVAKDICQDLLRHGAKPFRCDMHGDSSIHWAARLGKTSILRILLDAADETTVRFRPNKDGNTPLHEASRECFVDCLKLVLKFVQSMDTGENKLERGSPHPDSPPAILLHRNALCQTAYDVAADHYASNEEIRAREREKLKRIAREKQAIRQQIQELFCDMYPFFRTLVLHHEDCFGHLPFGGNDKDVWEAPARLTAIMACINEFKDSRLTVSEEFDNATKEMLESAHSKEYVSFVHEMSSNVSPSSPVPFTPRVQESIQNIPQGQLKTADACDTSFSQGSLHASLRAAGSVCHAIDHVMTGRQRNAFCIVRPPGHHAGIDGLVSNSTSCGFCIFNNVMVGALHARKAYPDVKRIAIIDFDVHHGNGTEEIVVKHNAGLPAADKNFLFFSSHIYDAARPGSNFEFYPGTGKDSMPFSNVINVPLAPLWRKKKTGFGKKSWAERFYLDHWGRKEFRRIVAERLIPPLRAFNPDLIIISAGFDAGIKDVGNGRYMPRYASGFNLHSEDFFWVTAEISRVADMCCDGRIVSVLEGGYGKLADPKTNPSKSSIDRTSLARNCLAHICGLIDTQDMVYPIESEEGSNSSSSSTSDEDEKPTDEIISDRRSRTRRRPARFDSTVDPADDSSARGKRSARRKRRDEASSSDSDKSDSEGEFSEEESASKKRAGKKKIPKTGVAKRGRPPGSKTKKLIKDEQPGEDQPKKKAKAKKKSEGNQNGAMSTQEQGKPEGKDDKNRELKKEDALEYLRDVKKKYESKVYTYRRFLAIMGDFKKQRLDVKDVIYLVKQLFHGDTKLIMGFNTFLPPGYQISLEECEESNNAPQTTARLPGAPEPSSQQQQQHGLHEGHQLLQQEFVQQNQQQHPQQQQQHHQQQQQQHHQQHLQHQHQQHLQHQHHGQQVNAHGDGMGAREQMIQSMYQSNPGMAKYLQDMYPHSFNHGPAAAAVAAAAAAQQGRYVMPHMMYHPQRPQQQDAQHHFAMQQQMHAQNPSQYPGSAQHPQMHAGMPQDGHQAHGQQQQHHQ